MKCRECNKEVPDQAAYCPVCGVNLSACQQAVALGSQPSGQGAKMVAALSLNPAEQAESAGISIDDVVEEPKKQPEPPLVRPTGWRPKRDRVRAWVGRELNHYEVLDLEESAPDSMLQERMKELDKALSEWKNERDTRSQELGREGKKWFYFMQEAWADRAQYNEQVKQERHQRAVNKIKQMALDDVSKDNVLQWLEWLSLKQAAQDAGLIREELEQIIKELKAKGVLTGVSVAGQEARTLIELKDLCGGRSNKLMDVMWNGELERWLEMACDKASLAEEVRRIKADFSNSKQLGAQVWLWSIGEERLILNGSSGVEEINSISAWFEAVTNRGLASVSIEALEDGRLENWLRVAMKQDGYARLAAATKGRGKDAFFQMIEQIKAASTGQLRAIPPYKLGNEEARSVSELIRLCDKHKEEAAEHIWQGLIQGWMGANLGEGSLARKASVAIEKYPKQKLKALELFVREMCKAEKINPYPQMVALPRQINIGQIPVGAQSSQTIIIKNMGRGDAWGTVSVEPQLPGLSTTSTFDGLDAHITVDLDTLEVGPGCYTGSIVVRAEEAPEVYVIPVEYEVIMLAVRIDPPALDIGVIPFGTQYVTSLRVECSPAGGRLSGTPSVNSPAHGVALYGNLYGNSSDFRVSIDTSPLEAGRGYKTGIRFETNVGHFEVPVHFRTRIRRDIVLGWTLGLAVAVGVLMSLLRVVLAGADPVLNHWFSSYVEVSSLHTGTLVVSGLFGAALILTIVLVVRQALKKK